MNSRSQHIGEARFAELQYDELSTIEADHLATCALCEARWQQDASPLLAALRPVAPPASLVSATLARFDTARAMTARARRRTVVLGCLLVHASALLALALLMAQGGSLLARLSVGTAQLLALLRVSARLLAHFPLTAAVHATAMALCAVLLAGFWAHVARARPHAAAK